MKRDWDLLREQLLAIEEDRDFHAGVLGGLPDTPQWPDDQSEADFVKAMKEHQKATARVFGHLELLVDNGYVEWLQKFTTPVEGPEYQEPASQVSIATMLKHVDQQVPHAAAEFSRLLTTIKAMHSFVHSGSRAVAHALMPSYPPENLMAVIWNRNLLQWYTANAAVIAAQDQGLVPRMRLLREKHGECMPPTSGLTHKRLKSPRNAPHLDVPRCGQEQT